MLQIGALPSEQKAIKILNRDRLNLRAQSIDREPMNSRKQPAIAPFLFCRGRMKFSSQNKPFRFEGEERRINFGTQQSKYFRELAGRDRPANFHSSAD